MSSRGVEFVIGLSPGTRKKKSKGFDLCYAYPTIDTNTVDNRISSVVHNSHVNPRSSIGDDDEESTSSGLCVSAKGPLTSSVIKPYQLARLTTITVDSAPRCRSKLLEIAVRDARIHRSFNGSQAPMEIASVSVLFKDKVVCTSSSPFNRKLHKLLVDDSSDPNNLSIRVQSRCDNSSTLPLPLPGHCVRDWKVEIDFSMCDSFGRIHSGTVLCTISLSIQDSEGGREELPNFCKANGDCYETRNSLSLRSSKRLVENDPVDYFRLYDPALCLDGAEAKVYVYDGGTKSKLKCPEIVVSEQPSFSMIGLSLGRWFQARRPLRPSSGNAQQHRTGREEIVTITVLRGVEVPVREESALVQPVVVISWGSASQSTSAADGPAPIWQQTIEFEVPRRGSEQQCVKLSLYDQHPIWGLQWLGEASIPLEFHRNHQELERWIGLSPLCSPLVRFGYVQASPVRSFTRIYVLVKMERPGNLANSLDIGNLDSLAKSIQRCLAVPIKIPGIESPDDCAKLTMLLTTLPNHYGPLTPRQALKLNKVDDYGRAALLATLLQGLGLDAYVLLGYSQLKKYAGFVVSFDENGTSPCLWDPENGEHYDFGDSRCSLIKTSRMINHQNIWRNIQKATTVPFNLRFNPKSNKDWQALPNTLAAGSSSVGREAQTLELGDANQEEDELHVEMERHLREQLSQWRSSLALTTIFNRHAVTILRSYLSKFNSRTDSQPDKKELRQLYRAYHTHGFILNLRRVTTNELADQLHSTKIHAIAGPVEFAIVCRVQKHIAKTCSIWLAVVVLRDRD